MAKKIVPFRETPRQDDAGAAELKPAPRPAWMSDTEARLYDELVTTTRKLAARGVPVSYVEIAEVAEAMELAHREGRSALTPIAEALDSMRGAERQHRAALVAHRKKVLGEEGNGVFCVFSAFAGLASFALTLAGLGGAHYAYFLWAAFFAAVAGAILLPVIIDLRNR